jgi:hypothetical protein
MIILKGLPAFSGRAFILARLVVLIYNDQEVCNLKTMPYIYNCEYYCKRNNTELCETISDCKNCAFNMVF